MTLFCKQNGLVDDSRSIVESMHDRAAAMPDCIALDGLEPSALDRPRGCVIMIIESAITVCGQNKKKKSTNRVFRPTQPGASASAPSRAAPKQARV